MKIKHRLICTFNSFSGNLFFDLVDYRNNLFTSNDPNKIIEFYNGFVNRDQLIKWMRERPKGVAHVHEVEGDKDIIVVIPTVDYEGEYAKECRENIFNGLHIVFVESGGMEDFYFNIAHNINVGIKKALEHNPKWIVFSSDDMYKLDDISVLKDSLKKIDPKNVDIVFTQPSKYHSSPERIAEPNFLYYLYYSIANRQKNAKILMLQKKFGIKYNMCPPKGLFSHLFKKGYEYTEIQDFAIFSTNWVNLHAGNIYDETFINAAEDTDLSLKFSLNPASVGRIKYKIGDYIGSTLGVGYDRGLRSIAGVCYLNYKWSKELDRLISNNTRKH